MTPATSSPLSSPHALALANVRLVNHMVKRFLPLPTHYRGEIEDLLQVGYLALHNAAIHFDPHYGTRFSTYACRSIHSWLHREVTSDTTINLHGWKSKGKSPLQGEKRRARHVRSLDGLMYDEENHAGSWSVDYREGPEEIVERREAIEAVRTAISRLPTRYRKVATLLLQMTAADAARKLGITRERVRQLRLLVWERLRAALGEWA